jgi:multimeric flavodoxin WrbA
MHILAFNGSPRKKGNTSTLIRAVLDGAASAGARTTEVFLYDIDNKGCSGCLSCRENPGKCAVKDQLGTYLEEIKTCDGMLVGCPIYMYRISGQMKLFVDRCFSLYISRPEGGYDSAVPAGKTYGLVISQEATDPAEYARSIHWLARLTGSGLGMREVGRIIHTNSAQVPASENRQLLEEAYRLGLRLAGA